MSRVTIGDLVEDYRTDSIDVNALASVNKIEVVPRKMVELIIKRCEENWKIYGGYTDRGKEAFSIGIYAEQLLKQFEEGND